MRPEVLGRSGRILKENDELTPKHTASHPEILKQWSAAAAPCENGQTRRGRGSLDEVAGVPIKPVSVAVDRWKKI